MPLLNQDDGYTALRERLSELVHSIRAYSNGRIPIQLALADPVLSSYILEFESLPSGKEERNSLITWQLGKQYHAECRKLALTHQYMGKRLDKHIVFVLAVDKLLIEAIMGVFLEVNLTPTVLDAGASYLYNAFAGQIRSQNAMAVNMEEAYWTLMIWDKFTGLQYMRSRWHDGPAGVYQELNMEIERTARAFVHNGEGRSIDAIHLLGQDAHTSALHSRFHDNVQAHCSIHKGEKQFSGSAMDGDYIGWTLRAASLCRNA